MSLLSGVTSGTSAADGTQSATSQAKLEEDLNQFLNLLVTQLKNQDPLDPMDSSEFTQQLVQYASVEQQIYANSHLEALLNLQESSQVASMVDYLGNTIEAVGNRVNIAEDGGSAEFSFTLGESAYSNLISISNAEGVTVFTYDAETSIGRHDFEWNGTDKSGNPVPAGTYTIHVLPTDREGNVMDVGQTVWGKVTGAGADDGNVYLYMGDVVVPMSYVMTVKESPPDTTTTTTTTDDQSGDQTETTDETQE